MKIIVFTVLISLVPACLGLCDPNCDSCSRNGPGRCDDGQCHERYTLNRANKTCLACAPNCIQCSNNGAGKCDDGQCDRRYMLDTVTKTCLARCTGPHTVKCERDDNSVMTRWYYNTKDNTCKHFLWSGCDRQDNNFEFGDECTNTCVGSNGQPKSTSPKCQGGPHRGSCVRYERGEDGPMTQWYYDAASDSCKHFTWSGCERQPNNFDFEFACIGLCVGSDGSHPRCQGAPKEGQCQGQPFEGNKAQWWFDNTVKECKIFWWSGCDRGPNNFDLEEECMFACMGNNVSGDPRCEGQPQVGVCEPYDRGTSEPIKQWYYNSGSNTCEIFMWSGCDEQPNNFDLKDTCVSTCVGQHGQKSNSEKCQGRPHEGYCEKALDAKYIRNWYYNPSSNACEGLWWSGCDRKPNNFDFKSACINLCVGTNGPKSNSTRCLGAPHQGRCVRYERGEDGVMTQWYYDRGSNTCKHFLYSGCDRQPNNFDHEDDCVNSCVGANGPASTEPKCQGSPHRGVCPQDQSWPITQWYFDTNTGSCRSFNWNGCERQPNNFDYQQACESTCL